MADIIMIPISGVLPKEGSSVVGIGGIGGSISGVLTVAPSFNNTGIASGYDARFDSRLIEGIKVKTIP